MTIYRLFPDTGQEVSAPTVSTHNRHQPSHPLSVAIASTNISLADNVNYRLQLVPELITYRLPFFFLINDFFNDFLFLLFICFLSWYIYRVVTQARACVMRRLNVLECVSMMT